ncbi:MULTISPECIES: hypothetical protein [Clavibacter]|jgi:hypothetical protein|uniref:Uncharacterized protein n=3 Tax=Clavibacter TaxID=1573 RepID=A0A399NXY6_9MICO|nr:MULTISPECIES: hypothetical protein [Clavibacter]RII98764.1 hypothetical protein DZF96_01590 [Clavibacter michiganensis]KDP90551.1 hypothetical protein W824_13755 [Clavibacter cf. michiganensis LMG 26808]RII93834.1 hypothetical protein DZF98_03285 [Clavibacter californiensis]UKF26338.1 hypothetical protein KYT88_06470 [Clavibacter sp. A6099]UKF78832.1 hypothetical protein FGD68_08405 [Clavibacter californiensis]
MGHGPYGALSRDEVAGRLAEGCAWRISWCSGGRLPDARGVGRTLPDGVLERVPSPAKLRGGILPSGRNWMLVVEREEAGRPVLLFDEGPEHRHV